MQQKQLFLILCLICFIAFACASKKKYLEVETNCLTAQNKLEEEKKKLKSLELRFRESQEDKRKNLKEISVLQTRCMELEKENQQLIKEMAALRRELDKTKSVMQLQGKVISLLDDPKQTIEKSLKEKLAEKNIHVEDIKETSKLTFAEKIIFNPGGVTISERGKELLQKIADSVKGNANQRIVVQGHTDDLPISSPLKEKFPTNWELSAARAASVVRFLHEEGGLAPERLSVCGFSFYRPIASNRTEAGRSQNRRIEILLDSSD
jgi:chemotaxis protein MotB